MHCILEVGVTGVATNYRRARNIRISMNILYIIFHCQCPLIYIYIYISYKNTKETATKILKRSTAMPERRRRAQKYAITKLLMSIETISSIPYQLRRWKNSKNRDSKNRGIGTAQHIEILTADRRKYRFTNAELDQQTLYDSLLYCSVQTNVKYIIFYKEYTYVLT